MDVKVDRDVPLDTGVDAGWAVLGDVRSVAACMPGAQITEQIDERRYKGTVTSRVGPVTLRFSGEIEVLTLDAAAREVRLLGKAADQAGSSTSMDLTARIVPADRPGRAVLAGRATLSVSGKLAQFGGRLIGPASDAILAQFGENFRAAAARIPYGGDPAPLPRAPQLSAVWLLWGVIVRGLRRLLRQRPD